MVSIEVAGAVDDLLAAPQVWAAIISSVLALGAAIIAAVIAARQGSQTRAHANKLYRANLTEARRKEKLDDIRFREFTGRDQWWREFIWAADNLHSTDPRRRQSGLSVLKHLSTAPWVGPEEKRTIASILVP
ncbi:hypothetical protein [Specibacter cremeus]|uniref:hypothetical protein n=1 Tax=Specibacter cremeus TaxID=1629051 RepID=UPI000F7710FC|nr:hypothetical protein [Specibacter cremeus]